jgi:hypothetical protein
VMDQSPKSLSHLCPRPSRTATPFAGVICSLMHH